MARKKIPEKTAALVMFRSDRRCCICENAGDHIHHLYENSNNEFDNLALLCFPHHNEASITGSLKRKLTAETIIMYRDLWYETVDNKRNQAKSTFYTQINQLTSEDLLIASKNALIIIEIEKLKEEFDQAPENKKDSVLEKLCKFYDHKNVRISHDIFAFLELVSEGARFGMSSNLALRVQSLIVNFFPYAEAGEDQNPVLCAAETACTIAYNIVYDTARYLRNYDVAMWGLNILKFLYMKGKSRNIPGLIDLVNSTYNDLQTDYIGEDPTHFRELIAVFKSDLDQGNMRFPMLPEHLMNLVYSERKKEVNS